MPESSTRIIGFRLTPRDGKRLESLAARQGMSPGELARTIVLARLDDTTSDHLIQLAEGLRGDVASLRHSFEALREELVADD